MGSSLASVLHLAWVFLDGESFIVALFFAPLGPVPALGFLPDELPCNRYPVAAQLFAELRRTAVGDEDHGHDFLLGDVFQVALVRDVQNCVRVLDHELATLLRQLEEFHASVPFRDPFCDDVHAGLDLVFVGLWCEDRRIVAEL